MHLVDRAAADRVVRVVAQQLPPGKAEVCCRVGGVTRQRGERGGDLGGEEPPLRALVRLLDLHVRRVDAAQDVLLAAPEQLALIDGRLLRLRARHVLVE